MKKMSYFVIFNQESFKVMKIKDLFRLKGRTDVFALGEKRLEKLRAESRYSCYRNTRATLRKLSLFVKGRPLPAGRVTPELVDAFRRWLTYERGNSHNTATENIKILAALLDEAGVKENPCRVRPLGREETSRCFLLEEELSRMMALRIKPGSEMEVARDLFFVECRTGLRISDLLQLRWDEYDGTYLRIRMQKTRRPVLVPVTDGVKAVLERYRTLFSGQEPYVFPMLQHEEDAGDTFSHAKALVSATGRVNQCIKRVAKRAGVQKTVSTHVGRHTFATSLLSKGASIYDVKELLGHRDVKVTQVYAHLVDRRKQELVELLE